MNRKKNKGKKLPLQDGVLICNKRAEKGKISVCVSSIPSLCATATNLKTAEELLQNRLWSEYDLNEPVAFRYEVDGNLDSNDVLVRIVPNEPADASTPPDRYFTEGFCSICQSAKGVRNNKPLQLDGIGKQVSSGLFIRFQPILKFGLRIHIRSLNHSICEAIEKICSPPIEFRRVKMESGAPSKFCEPISNEIIPCVVPLTRKGRAGGKCSACGASFIYHEASKLFIHKNNGNLIRQRGIAVVDSTSNPILCVSGNMWLEIKKLRASRGLVAYPVYELKGDEICKNPKFERVVPFKL